MKVFVWTLVVVAFLGVMFFVNTIQHQADQQYIQAWAVENNHVVAQTEQCYVELGPYWYRGKAERIYKVKVEADRTFWFRFGPFQTEVKER